MPVSPIAAFGREPVRRSVLRVLLLLAASCGAASFAAEAVSPEERFPPPGLYRRTLTLENGDELRYGLFVPDLDPGTAAPLVVALHYGGQVTPHYGFQYLECCVAPGLKALGAVIVAPDCPGQGWKDPASERAVLELLDRAQRDWPVDRRRTAVTGFSMGAMGAWFLIERHPERFSAALPVAGRPTGATETTVPVFAIHSSRDEVIELEPTRRAIEALRGRGVKAELVVVSSPTHYETATYSLPLRRAADWLLELWAGEPRPADQ